MLWWLTSLLPFSVPPEGENTYTHTHMIVLRDRQKDPLGKADQKLVIRIEI